MAATFEQLGEETTPYKKIVEEEKKEDKESAISLEQLVPVEKEGKTDKENVEGMAISNKQLAEEPDKECVEGMAISHKQPAEEEKTDKENIEEMAISHKQLAEEKKTNKENIEGMAISLEQLVLVEKDGNTDKKRKGTMASSAKEEDDNERDPYEQLVETEEKNVATMIKIKTSYELEQEEANVIHIANMIQGKTTEEQNRKEDECYAERDPLADKHHLA